MGSYFSEDVVAGLQAAKTATDRKKTRLRVHAGDQQFAVTKAWRGGFSVDAENTPHLRGLVDLFDSGKHLAQCLIIRSERVGANMRYEYKRRTEISDAAALDYAVDKTAPVALLR